MQSSNMSQEVVPKNFFANLGKILQNQNSSSD